MTSSRLLRLAWLAGWLALACLPLVASDYYTGLALKIVIAGLFALSLQLLVGGAGLISLGHAAFFGVGAYASVLLAPEAGPGSFLLLALGAMGCAMLLALVTGALALRTQGIYFIMITLAFAQMAYYVFHDTDLGGGSDGAYLYFRPEVRLGESFALSLDSDHAFYLCALLCLAGAWALLSRLMRSRFGATLTGLRINEQRMRSLGYHSLPYRLTAYVMAAALAGLSGMLYALKDGYVNPQLLSWEQSGIVLLMVILGGQQRLWGAVAGALTFTLLEELFQSHALFGDLATHWHLSLGVAIIVLVGLLPQGLAGLLTTSRRKRAAAALPAASP